MIIFVAEIFQLCINFLNMSPKFFFNTTGPCNPDEHYMLSPHERLVDAQLHRYIRNKLYWVLHAPRQVGKTTFLIQVRKYRDKFGAQTPAYLIIFDRRSESVTKSWDERITWEIDGDVTVLGC